MRRSLASTVWVILTVASGATPPSAWAATYVIQPDGGGDFPTIQTAIDTVVASPFSRASTPTN